MRQIRLYGSEGGAAQLNAPSLPLSQRVDQYGDRSLHDQAHGESFMTS